MKYVCMCVCVRACVRVCVCDFLLIYLHDPFVPSFLQLPSTNFMRSGSSSSTTTRLPRGCTKLTQHSSTSQWSPVLQYPANAPRPGAGIA